MVKLRNTIQKIRIMDYLESVNNHPNAEKIYNEVKKDVPTITLATVYRNLNLLAEEGKILKIEVNNEFHFDADLRNHQHFVCKKCGKIYDNFQEDVTKYVLNNINNTKFDVSNVQIILYGLCENCKNGGKKNGR